MQPLGSTPRSKRNEASVFSPWRRAVLRTEVGWKQALSRNTEVVASVTPEPMPPNTPAMHMGSRLLQIIRSAPSRVRSTPSRVVNLVPAAQVFTTMLSPAILSRSKQCRGWPKPWSM